MNPNIELEINNVITLIDGTRIRRRLTYDQVLEDKMVNNRIESCWRDIVIEFGEGALDK